MKRIVIFTVCTLNMLTTVLCGIEAITEAARSLETRPIASSEKFLQWAEQAKTDQKKATDALTRKMNQLTLNRTMHPKAVDFLNKNLYAKEATALQNLHDVQQDYITLGNLQNMITNLETSKNEADRLLAQHLNNQFPNLQGQIDTLKQTLNNRRLTYESATQATANYEAKNETFLNAPLPINATIAALRDASDTNVAPRLKIYITQRDNYIAGIDETRNPRIQLLYENIADRLNQLIGNIRQFSFLNEVRNYLESRQYTPEATAILRKLGYSSLGELDTAIATEQTAMTQNLMAFDAVRPKVQ